MVHDNKSHNMLQRKSGMGGLRGFLFVSYCVASIGRVVEKVEQFVYAVKVQKTMIRICVGNGHRCVIVKNFGVVKMRFCRLGQII